MTTATEGATAQTAGASTKRRPAGPICWFDLWLWLLVLIGLIDAAQFMCWYWPGSVFQGETSGTWMALADDFAHGTLYRPLVGDLGYGGTRYMPLGFMLAGWLLRGGVDPLAAGVLLVQVGNALLAVFVYAWLRHAGNGRLRALGISLLLYCSTGYVEDCVQTRADYLAAALNVGGLYLVFRSSRSAAGGWLAAAAGLFVLAFMTRLTAVSGLAAAVLFLWSERPSRAVRLLAFTLAGVAVGLAWTQVASEGNFARVVSRCLWAGGDGALAVQGAWRLVRKLSSHQPNGLLFLGAALIFARQAALRRSLAGWYFIASTLVTVAVFGSPGTQCNHLIDLYAGCLILIGLALPSTAAEPSTRPPPALKPVGMLLALSVLLSIGTWCPEARSKIREMQQDGRCRLESIRTMQARFSGTGGTAFAINPMVPLVWGERPVVLDAFNLGWLLEKDVEVAADFERKVRQRTYAVVVLDNYGAIFQRDLLSARDAELVRMLPGYYRAWEAEQPRLKAILLPSYHVAAALPPFVVLIPGAP